MTRFVSGAQIAHSSPREIKINSNAVTIIADAVLATIIDIRTSKMENGDSN